MTTWTSDAVFHGQNRQNDALFDDHCSAEYDASDAVSDDHLTLFFTAKYISPADFEKQYLSSNLESSIETLP